jgi:hypothetical protein
MHYVPLIIGFITDYNIFRKTLIFLFLNEKCPFTSLYQDKRTKCSVNYKISWYLDITSFIELEYSRKKRD